MRGRKLLDQTLPLPMEESRNPSFPFGQTFRNLIAMSYQSQVSRNTPPFTKCR